MNPKRSTGIAIALLVLLGFLPASAVDRMVGIEPADGSGWLIKEFTPSAGASIQGVRFSSNDVGTVFPEVVLLKGPLSHLSEALEVDTAVSVQSGTSGEVSVRWREPYSVQDGSSVYVAVRLPAGSSRVAAGEGAGVGAFDVSSPGGSYLAWGQEEPLVKLVVDLDVALMYATGKASGVLLQPEAVSEKLPESFHVRGVVRAGSPAVMELRLDRSQTVEVVLYDVRGRRVRGMVEGVLTAGERGFLWDGRDDRGKRVGPGVYWVRARWGDRVESGRVVVTR